MNEPHDGDARNGYDEFVSDVEVKFSLLWGLAKRKLEEEAEAIREIAISEIFSPGMGLITAGYAIYNDDVLGKQDACNKEETKEKILDFAKNYCFDYLSVNEMIATLHAMGRNFGIGTKSHDIARDLEASWPAETNKSAKAFRDNYVDTIGDIFDDQKVMLKFAEKDLEAIPELVKENRKALMDALTDITDQLESFDPRKHLAINMFHIKAFVIGLVLPDPVSGRVASIADVILSKSESSLIDTDVGWVADFFTKLRDGLDEAGTSSQAVIDGVIAALRLKYSEWQNDAETYILKGPEIPEDKKAPTDSRATDDSW